MPTEPLPPQHGSAEPTWPSEWLRGVLELCVLRVLADGATYGYAVATRLADSGLGTVKGGTLYPLLIRLEAAGLVAAQWRAGEGGPGRKYYELTAHGRDELASTADRWSRFTALTGEIIDAPPTPILSTSTSTSTSTGEVAP
ncbi:MAG: PadR family transcriptional regulator [Cellulomonas sp.]